MSDIKQYLLVGFMGAGKSSVAEIASKQLDWKLFELDHEILKISGFESIPEIFKTHGEAEFRKYESMALMEALKYPENCIISAGGGILEQEDNRRLISNSRLKIVYLEADFEVVKSRIGNVEDRPLFENEKSALELYRKRRTVYQDTANYIINTNDLSLDQVVSNFIELIKDDTA